MKLWRRRKIRCVRLSISYSTLWVFLVLTSSLRMRRDCFLVKGNHWFNLKKKLHLFIYVSVGGWGGSRCFPFSLWILGTKLRSPGLAVSSKCLYLLNHLTIPESLDFMLYLWGMNAFSQIDFASLKLMVYLFFIYSKRKFALFPHLLASRSLLVKDGLCSLR